MHELLLETIDTPLGSMDVVAEPHALVSVDFSDCRDRMFRLLQKRLGPVSLIHQPHVYSQSLLDYFEGHLDAIRGVNMLLRGTPFQHRVWNQLAQIPAGTTLTYGAIAQALGQPRAAQAVGRANSQNPILIFLPCHRVIGKHQTMVGYSAGEERKALLLKHEAQALAT